jgi:hypothetical protein
MATMTTTARKLNQIRRYHGGLDGSNRAPLAALLQWVCADLPTSAS